MQQDTTMVTIEVHGPIGTRKSYMNFRLVWKSTTSDDLWEIQGHWYRKCRKL